MYSPLAISNYFISKSFASGDFLTPMKLLKLVYISHGYYLALTGKELITEAVQAWKYGPVIPSVYHEFKQYGNNQITSMALDGNEAFNIDNENVQKFLDKIWELYANYDGLQLSALTHQPNTPWYQTWHKEGKVIHGTIIPNDLIEVHYKSLLNGSKP